MKNFCGFSPAVVINNADPENLGRLQVRLAGVDGEMDREVWARLATLVAGNRRGTWFIPEVDDEVLLAFEGGDERQFYVIGSLWNKSHPPPETMSAQNDKKVLRLRSGLQIALSERDGQESFVVETPDGQSLTLKDGPGSVVIKDSMGNVVALEGHGVTVHSPATVTISASSVEVSAGMLRVTAPFAKFDGVVVCDTLISKSVVSASYTPGAGNIW
jgi:uncharacterized protein involved in type VI secretion and phage assembly